MQRAGMYAGGDGEATGLSANKGEHPRLWTLLIMYVAEMSSITYADSHVPPNFPHEINGVLTRNFGRVL